MNRIDGYIEEYISNDGITDDYTMILYYNGLSSSEVHEESQTEYLASRCAKKMDSYILGGFPGSNYVTTNGNKEIVINNVYGLKNIKSFITSLKSVCLDISSDICLSIHINKKDFDLILNGKINTVAGLSLEEELKKLIEELENSSFKSK